MAASNAPLQLAQAEPVARGSERRIYLHPTLPERLLKIADPRRIRRPGLRRVAQALLPNQDLRGAMAEQKAQTRAFLRAPEAAGPPPFARLFGYVETDLGWALEVERITDGNRAIGPTLREIAAQGALPQDLLDLLNDTVARVRQWNLRASDLHPRNFVLGQRNGGPEFVLVDGLGDIHAVPIRSWSDRLNRLANAHEFGRLAPRLGLRWDPQTWRFSPGGPRHH